MAKVVVLPERRPQGRGQDAVPDRRLAAAAARRQDAGRPRRPRRARRARASRSCAPASPAGTRSSPTRRSRPSAQRLDAAAAPALRCWPWLGDLTDLPLRKPSDPPSPRSACSRASSTRSRATRALLAWKGVDEPRNPYRGDNWIRPAGPRARLREGQGARPGPPGRDHPDAAEHGRRADAVPAGARHHRRRHLPGLVPAGRARRRQEQGHQRRRRRDAQDARRRGPEAGVDDAADRVERRRPRAGPAGPVPRFPCSTTSAS